MKQGLTREEHLALVPWVSALRRSIPMASNLYPKNSRVNYHLRKIGEAIDHLRCQLDSQWFKLAGSETIIYYGEGFRTASDDIVAGRPADLDHRLTTDHIRWVQDELLAAQIIERLSGHRPVALLDAALKIDGRLPNLIVALEDTPMRKKRAA